MKYLIRILAIVFILSAINLPAMAGSKNKKTLTTTTHKTKDRKQMLEWYKAMQEKGKDSKKAKEKKIKGKN